MIQDQERAEERRAALRSIMSERDLTATELARRTQKRVTAGALSNFLCGQSSSLNIAVVEALSETLGVPIEDLIGFGGVLVERVSLKGAVTGDAPVEHVFWDQAEWVTYTMPIGRENVWLMMLDSEEMNQIWPRGTVLALVSPSGFGGPIPLGRRVVTVTTAPDGHKRIELHEIAPGNDGTRCSLVARSDDPRYQGRTIPLPWPIALGEQTLPNGDRIAILGVVVRTITEED